MGINSTRRRATSTNNNNYNIPGGNNMATTTFTSTPSLLSFNASCGSSERSGDRASPYTVSQRWHARDVGLGFLSAASKVPHRPPMRFSPPAPERVRAQRRKPRRPPMRFSPPAPERVRAQRRKPPMDLRCVSTRPPPNACVRSVENPPWTPDAFQPARPRTRACATSMRRNYLIRVPSRNKTPHRPPMRFNPPAPERKTPHGPPMRFNPPAPERKTPHGPPMRFNPPAPERKTPHRPPMRFSPPAPERVRARRRTEGRYHSAKIASIIQLREQLLTGTCRFVEDLIPRALLVCVLDLTVSLISR
ncbi:hypothetical protein B0H19DRAFT_1259649 [Mycena capillaripes]|nr:hypothetical protein B0H19DRAFT_1259649 [Mycena capillaripes]